MRTVSVIVPTFNRAKTVKAAIDSVLGQVPAPFEVIVVDDGSTDDTREVLEAYSGMITVIHQVNRGVGAARNAGILAAKGDWVAFLDSDDLWLPGRLAVFHRDIDVSSEDVVLHTANLLLVGRNYSTNLFEHRRWHFPNGRAVVSKSIVQMALSGLFSQSTIVLRTTALACGGFAEGTAMHEEMGFFVRTAMRGGCLVSADIVANVQRLDQDFGSLSSLEQRDFVKSRDIVVEMLTCLSNEFTSPPEGDIFASALSGTYLELACFYSKTDPSKEFTNLKNSVLHHSRKTRAIFKFLCCLVFGNRAYTWFLGKRFVR